MIIRGLIVLVVIAGISALAAWLSDHPGTVSLVWQGYRVDTSVGILLLAVALVAIAVALVYRLWVALRAASRGAIRARRTRRTREGYLALSRGLVAVAAGDADEAKRQANRAHALLEEPALTHLLAAQAAQLDGNEAAARRYFTDLLESKETEFLGVRGLLNLAEAEGQDDRALELARRAAELRPEIPWVHEKHFQLEVEAGNWPEAERTITKAIKRRVVSAEKGREQHAAVLLEQSRQEQAKDNLEAATRHARKALEQAPGWTPAAIRLATLLLEVSDPGRAKKVIETAFASGPHPELARLYLQAEPSDDPIKRLKALERLQKLSGPNPTTELIMAEASLEARLWGEARRHLKEAASDGPPTALMCRLLAEIEEGENGDTPAARAWYARATEAEPDLSWVCNDCGAVADDWNAVCANCGDFGAMAWRTPPRVSTLPAPEAAVIAEAAIAPPPRQPNGGNGQGEPEAEVVPPRPD